MASNKVRTMTLLVVKAMTSGTVKPTAGNQVRWMASNKVRTMTLLVVKTMTSGIVKPTAGNQVQ